jgi:death-on-curing protein
MEYIDYSRICHIYSNVVHVSGGGANGVLDDNKLKGILEQVKNDEYYPTMEDKLAYLFFSLNKYHCFMDGNKRIALAACVDFLNLNGYLFILNRFLREMENYSIHVASGAIGRELLRDIIESIIYEDDFNEDLKLRIIEALI